MPSSLKNIRALVFDVDGVLTSGKIIYGPGGEWKVFDVKDGHGFVIARRMGLKTAILTARTSRAVAQRAKDLRVDALVQGAHNKAAGLTNILKKLRIPAAAACYVGDDLVDLPAMELAGCAVAVADAVPEVIQNADLVLKKRGGKGAARELIEQVLRAQGLWNKAVQLARNPG